MTTEEKAVAPEAQLPAFWWWALMITCVACLVPYAVILLVRAAWSRLRHGRKDDRDIHPGEPRVFAPRSDFPSPDQRKDDMTMEAARLHFQVEHDTDQVTFDLVPVCSCGASMAHVRTAPTGGGFKDHVKCGACGNTGFVRRDG